MAAGHLDELDLDAVRAAPGVLRVLTAGDLANRIETFPSNLLAKMYGFQKKEFFEIEDSSQREAPPLDFTE